MCPALQTYDKFEAKGLKFKLEIQEVNEPALISQVFFEREDLLKLVRPRLLGLLLDTELAVVPRGFREGMETEVKDTASTAHASDDNKEAEQIAEMIKGGLKLPKLEAGVMRTDKLWMLVGVTLVSKEKWTLIRALDGKVAKQVDAERKNFWWFARGPVQVTWTPEESNSTLEIPSDTDFDSMPWFLLSTSH